MVTKFVEDKQALNLVGLALAAEFVCGYFIVDSLKTARQAFGIVNQLGAPLPTLGLALDTMSQHPAAVIVWQILLTVIALALAYRFLRNRLPIVIGVVVGCIVVFSLVARFYPIWLVRDLVRQLGG